MKAILQLGNNFQASYVMSRYEGLGMSVVTEQLEV